MFPLNPRLRGNERTDPLGFGAGTAFGDDQLIGCRAAGMRWPQPWPRAATRGVRPDGFASCFWASIWRR